MNNRIKTNIHLDGEIAGSSPDAQYDLYKTSDAQRDLNYVTSKLLDIFSALKGSALTEVILNSGGGKVTDSGAGQVDISALYGIGIAVDGDIRPVYIPALTNVSLPSGWDDGRAIWVIAKHEFLTTGSLRNHAKYPAETYHYQVIDSYYGNADSTLLFTDVSPAASTLILGKFTMTGTAFVDLGVRSSEVELTVNGLITANGGLSVETFIHYLTSGVEKAVDHVASDGSLWRMINVEIVGGAIKLKATGTAYRLALSVTNGIMLFDKYTGTAGDTISAWTPIQTVDSSGRMALNTAIKSISSIQGIETNNLFIGNSPGATASDVLIGINTYYDGAFKGYKANKSSSIFQVIKASGAGTLKPTFNISTYNDPTADDQVLTNGVTHYLPVCNENVRVMTLTGTFDVGSFVLAIPHGLTNPVSSNKIRGLLVGIYDATGIVFSSPYVAGVNNAPTFGTVDNTNVNIYRGATGITRIGWAILFYVD